jgi:hypothetical protein
MYVRDINSVENLEQGVWLSYRQLQVSRPNEQRVQEGQITEGLRVTRKRWWMPFVRLRKSLWRRLASKFTQNPSWVW